MEINNTPEIDLKKYNSKSIFPQNGIYIGKFESLIKEKMPALLYLSQSNGLCFLTKPENKEKMHLAMQSIALRFLLEVPSNLLKIKAYDPGTGANLITLAGLSERIIGTKILTQKDELKRMLENAAIMEIPNIIQKILGYKYKNKTLVEYNQIAGELAKPYNLLLISNYPYSFNTETNEQLFTILQSGKQAGYFTFVSVDTIYQSQKYSDINPLDIITKLPCIYENNGSFYVKGLPNDDYFNKKFKFYLHTEIPKNLEEIIEFINTSVTQIKTVAVSLLDKLTERNFWSKDASNGIKIPIGKLNFTDVKDFVLSIEEGENDNPYHCLIGGAIGSGKTVLLHNIVCNSAWLYSPKVLQLYLLDYKEGTEFKTYENLPHVKVLSVGSEREFGVSVLSLLDGEITRRGELFKKYNVENITNYNQLNNEKLPRILLIIDEFQKLLDGPVSVAKFTSQSLDDIGRRGRSFGLNIILSTQSLSGIDISQVMSHLGLRITLKLNTSRDCDQLLGSGNYAPYSSFTKRGEAIYNARGGLSEGNDRFQVAYIPDKKMSDLIKNIRKKSDKKYGKLPFKQFIYDGSLKSSTKNNPAYHNKTIDKNICTVYLGEPVTLQEEHIYSKLRKQNESNMVIVGRDIESAVSLFKHIYFQTQNQSTKKSNFYLCNKLNVDNQFYRVLENIKKVFHITEDKKIEDSIESIHKKLQERINGKDSSDRILFGIFDIYNVRILRKSGYNMSESTKKLNEIFADGSSFNIYCLIYAYSHQSLGNILDLPRSLNEFDTKIALRGGQGIRIFGAGMSEEPNSEGIAILSFEEEITKFKVYKI